MKPDPTKADRISKMTEPETEDIQFEINFYGNIIKDSPEFVEALSALAEAYTRSGEYQKGLDLDKRLAVLCPEDPLVFYNLACSFALLGSKDESFEALEAAVRFGYDEPDHMKEDEDLKSLHDDERFIKILERIT